MCEYKEKYLMFFFWKSRKNFWAGVYNIYSSVHKYLNSDIFSVLRTPENKQFSFNLRIFTFILGEPCRNYSPHNFRGPTVR